MADIVIRCDAWVVECGGNDFNCADTFFALNRTSGTEVLSCDNGRLAVAGDTFPPEYTEYSGAEVISAFNESPPIPTEIQLLAPVQTITSDDFGTLSAGILTAFVIAWGIRVIVKRIAPKL